MDWDAIIGHPMLHHLNTVMNVEHNRVSIQSKGKMRYDLNMLDRVIETPLIQTAATFTDDYESLYDSPNPMIHHHMQMKQTPMKTLLIHPVTQMKILHCHPTHLRWFSRQARGTRVSNASCNTHLASLIRLWLSWGNDCSRTASLVILCRYWWIRDKGKWLRL